MKFRNYESDFFANITLQKGLESSDFAIEFSTAKSKTPYKVSRISSQHRNCITLTNGIVKVIFKNHGLSPGALIMKFTSFIPNIDVPGDNIQKIVKPTIEDVELVTTAGDECCDVCFDIVIDYAVIDAYDMAVKAGYNGTREEYIKMISSKAKAVGSPILHRKCISYYSHAEEAYSGGYMIFPLNVDEFDISKEKRYLSLPADGVPVEGVNDPWYVVNGDKLTITNRNGCKRLAVSLAKKAGEYIKKTVNGRYEIGLFHVTEPSLRGEIKAVELGLFKSEKPTKEGYVSNCVGRHGSGLQVQIWKKIARLNAGRVHYGLRRWVCVGSASTAIGDYNFRSNSQGRHGYRFLLRARRVNRKITRVSEWEYFHVILNDDDTFTVRKSRASDRGESGKVSPTYSYIWDDSKERRLSADLADLYKGLNEVKESMAELDDESKRVLHILTSKATTATINGVRYNLPAGESVRDVPKDARMTALGADVVGIYRFDGVIGCAIKSRLDIIFIKNTTLEVADMVWHYGTKNLRTMENVIVKCLPTATSLYGHFKESGITIAPYIDNTSQVVEMADAFSGCANLLSVPLIDTSNVTNFRGCFNYCRGLVVIPTFNTSKGTNFQNFVSECARLMYLPALDFSNATNLTTAFMGIAVEQFPGSFNFAKVTVATYAFAGNWGFYNEQAETHAVGNMLRFPAYSLPECTDLLGAWMDQSKLHSIGKMNIPKCTTLEKAFHGCSNLTTMGGFTGLMCNIDMTFSKKLSAASMVNIIREAADVTALGVRTMTFGATNLAKLTDAQKAVASTKGWTLA